MKTSRARTTIRQTVTLPAAPGAVYSALIDTRQHARLTSAPARITSNGSQLVMLELNPGGFVGSHNRLSHLIWWAACFPEQAGKDPNNLQAIARKLGFSGNLNEREHLLPGNAR